jgi:hypothetical protein
MPLALVIFLIGLLIWQKIRTRAPWNANDRLSMFALLTAAMLIKGPIVYAFLLPGIALFQWRARKQSDVTAWSGWWPWLASLGIFIVWVIGGIFFQSGFFEQVVMREFVGRFGETIHRPQPFYFYLPHLIHKFAPWSVLMIALAILDVRARQKLDGLKPSSLKWWHVPKLSPETFWLVCWTLGGLLVMSLIPSKRVDRIFPVIPPLCLLLAVQIAHALRSRHGSVSSAAADVDADPAGRTENGETRGHVYLWSAAALALSILFTSVYTMSKVVTGYRDHRNALVIFGQASLALRSDPVRRRRTASLFAAAALHQIGARGYRMEPWSP